MTDQGTITKARSAANLAERNMRGSSYARRARRLFLASPEAGFGGDGHFVLCAMTDANGDPWHSAECVGLVSVVTMEVDKIVTWRNGGTYRRDNIRPVSGPCNRERGDRW